ncbi:hypothetical protein AD951_06360 [Acetobacter malorum]|uniref:Uncharacterized protein n=1 Tax=Acetobacter malorum TaxID=178901 RepID=A0A149UNF7_9PROT|nr:hypothetical protein AD951_06360 [Acetobacter malorum]
MASDDYDQKYCRCMRGPRERLFHGPATGEWHKNSLSLRQLDDFKSDITLFSVLAAFDPV